MIRSYLRQQRIYTIWRKYREWQHLRCFNLALDTYLDHRGKYIPPYSEGLVKARLGQRQAQRRPFLGPDGKPSIVAFGAQGWEKYGLWPSFERVSHFVLSEYGTEFIKEPFICSPAPAMRHQLAQGFLAFVDQVERERPVTCVYFYAAGEHISDELLAELARRGLWTVVMSLDDKHQFFRPTGDDTREPHQLRVARQCDLYWTTWKAGSQIVLGIGGTPWYAAGGADPAYHHPVDVPRSLEIIFIGQAYGTRVDLIRYLHRRGFQIETFGAGWPNRFASFKKTVELYSRARIVLGVGGVQNMVGVKHLKGRDFEVPMCGALYLTSYNPELVDYYQIGREILCYSSFEECADLLHWVLRHPEEQATMRRAALARSLKDHTWEKRLGQMFALFPREAGVEASCEKHRCLSSKIAG